MLIITLDPQLRYSHPLIGTPPGEEPGPPKEPMKLISISAWDTEKGVRWSLVAVDSREAGEIANTIFGEWIEEHLVWPEVPQWPR